MDDKNTAYNKADYTPEAKRARFLRVAERRTNMIINDIRLIANTSNKTLYQYTEADIDKIFDVINEKLAEAKMKFTASKKSEPFRLE